MFARRIVHSTVQRTLLNRTIKANIIMTSSYYTIRDLLDDDEESTIFNKGNIHGKKKMLVTKNSRSFEPYPTNQFVNGKFVTPYNKETNKRLFDVIRMVLTKKDKLQFKDDIDTTSLLTPVEVNRQLIRSTERPHLSWFGHASVYFQSDNCCFLTDPVWSERASPLPFAGPKRYTNPPIEIEDLKIDVVLLSHTHYDHLDMNTARRIGNRALWIVPKGVKSLLNSAANITNSVELDWWESYHHMNSNGELIEIMFLPSKHWTGRTLFDKNSCLWGSFAVLAPSSKFYFAGDTAYCDQLFKLIGKNLGPFDFAAIPIGAFSPRWFMKSVHVDPEEAIQIHREIGSKQSLAIHWGTFPLTDEDCIEAALELARQRDKHGLDTNAFLALRQGSTIVGSSANTSISGSDGASNNSVAVSKDMSSEDFSNVYNDVYHNYLEIVRSSL